MTRFLKSLFAPYAPQKRRIQQNPRSSRSLTAEVLEHRTLLASQMLASDATARTVNPGDTIDVPVFYTTLDDNGDPAALKANIFSGNLHFDSSVLTFVETPTSGIFVEDLAVAPNVATPETDVAVFGDDADATTDTVLLVSYTDTPTPVNPDFTGWPNVASTAPLQLFIARFTVNAGFSGSTNVNFSANSTGNVIGQPAEFDFMSTSLVLSTPAANNDPVIDSPASMTVAENQTAAIDVNASDADNDTLTYAITGGADAGLFGIDAATGVVTFNTAPDFEMPGDTGADNVYNFDVEVTDGNMGSATQSIAITVADVFENSDPVITSSATASVEENQTAAIDVDATDADNHTLTYAIVSGGDSGLFNIDSSTGVVTFVNAPDFEAPGDVGANNVYNFDVEVTDGNMGSATQSIAITVTDVRDTNENPIITSGNAVSVEENQTAAIDVNATDADNDTLTYAITGGADASLFSIDSASGVVTFDNAPDFEAPGDTGADNVYNIMVTVTDGNNGSAVQDIAITVTDVRDTNENPVITSGSAASVEENQTAAISVVATDPDNDPLTYGLTGVDAALFSVSQTGVVTFNNAPDFENPADDGGDNVYNFTVNVTDSFNGAASQQIAITVTDVDDNNTDPTIDSTSSATVAENQTAAITATATDAENDPISWFLAGGDSALFSISDTGVVTFNNAPDFENPSDEGGDNVYNFAITATDGRGGSATQDVAVTVTDVEEGPDPTGMVYGRKFNDLNGDGERDEGEGWLSGWTIELVDADGNVVDSQVTGDLDLNNDNQIDPETETGVYKFTVAPGTYTLREVAQEGWTQTSPTDAVEALAFSLDQQFNLNASLNDFLNWGGLNERWLWGSGEWYYITPEGSLFRWNGSPRSDLSGTHVADLTQEYWTNLSLLTEAQPAEFSTVDVTDGSMTRVDFGNQEDGVMPPISEYPGQGNIRAQIIGNRSLLLTGDTTGNGARVYVNDSGYVAVDGLGDTTINGQDSWVIESWTEIPGSLIAYFSLGDDALAVHDIAIGGNVTVSTATGNDFVLMDDVTIGGNATLLSSAGNNTFAVKDTNVGGNMYVSSGFGVDAVYTNSVSVAGRTTVLTRGGNDLFGFADTTFSGITVIDAGTGDDTGAVIGSTAFNSALIVYGRSGTDTVDVDPNATLPSSPVVSSVEQDSTDVAALLDSVMERLSLAGLGGLLD